MGGSMNRANKLKHLIMWNTQLPYQQRVLFLQKLKEAA